MRVIIGLSLILLFVLLGTKFSFYNRKIRMGFNAILLTGTEYMFIGILLGIQGLKIINKSAVADFKPFLVLTLTWVGFMFGLQFNVRKIRKLPSRYFSAAIITSAVTLFLTTFIIYTFSFYVLKKDMHFSLLTALTLGCAASCTAQSGLGIVSRNFRFRNAKLIEFLRFVSAVDSILAIIFLGIGLNLINPVHAGGFNTLNVINFIFVSIGAGILPALILILLSKSKFNVQEYLVYVTGIIMLCGGYAYKELHSPLFSGLICGFLVANFCRNRLHAFNILHRGEKSVYIIMLILLGAGWEYTHEFWYLILPYLLIRFAGKIIGGESARTVLNPSFKLPFMWGKGLTAEGGMSVAVVLSASLINPEISSVAVGVILIASLINEFLSPRMILSLFSEKTDLLKNGDKS